MFNPSPPFLKMWLHLEVRSEGVQDLPPQNVLLWHIGYFELKAPEKPQTWGGHSASSPCLLRYRTSKRTQFLSPFPEVTKQEG